MRGKKDGGTKDSQFLVALVWCMPVVTKMACMSTQAVKGMASAKLAALEVESKEDTPATYLCWQVAVFRSGEQSATLDVGGKMGFAVVCRNARMGGGQHATILGVLESLLRMVATSRRMPHVQEEIQSAMDAEFLEQCSMLVPTDGPCNAKMARG